jgi:hypothetical protein
MQTFFFSYYGTFRHQVVDGVEKKFISYLTENTVRLHYKDGLPRAAQEQGKHTNALCGYT